MRRLRAAYAGPTKHTTVDGPDQVREKSEQIEAWSGGLVGAAQDLRDMDGLETPRRSLVRGCFWSGWARDLAGNASGLP